MRYAVLSDVHANLEALRAVLSAVDELGISEIVCLGDIVGYHANPNECVALVRERGGRCVFGNHDRAATGDKDPIHFGAVGRAAVRWTRAVLEEESVDFLRRLPLTLELPLGDGAGPVLCVHGALHPSPNEDLHLSTPARIGASFARLTSGAFGARICLFGHTHRAAAYEHRDGGWSALGATAVDLDPHAHYLVNPGSVGQPRDGDARASFLVLDGERRRVEFHRVSYDVEACMAKARRAGLLGQPSRLARSTDWVLGKICKCDRLRARADGERNAGLVGSQRRPGQWAAPHRRSGQ